MKKIIIAVVPAYSEGSRIGDVVEKLHNYVDRVIVVDDSSIDATARVAKRKGAEVIVLEKNMGSGYATRAGCDAACEDAEIIVTLDADGQHDPENIPAVVGM